MIDGLPCPLIRFLACRPYSSYYWGIIAAFGSDDLRCYFCGKVSLLEGMRVVVIFVCSVGVVLVFRGEKDRRGFVVTEIAHKMWSMEDFDERLSF